MSEMSHFSGPYLWIPQFKWHGMTRTFTTTVTPPWTRCQSIAGLSLHVLLGFHGKLPQKLDKTVLVHTTQVNGAFSACWLASAEVNNKYHSPPSSCKDNLHHCKDKKSLISDHFLVFWEKCYLTFFGICVVHTKTIIHLSVCESGGCLPHHFTAW